MRIRIPFLLAVIIILLATVIVGAQQDLFSFANGIQFLEYYSSSVDKLIPALKPLDTALGQFQLSLDIPELADESLLFIALIHQEKGELEAAKADYTEYLVRNPEEVWAYALIGDLDYLLGDEDRAEASYHKALVADEYAKAYYGLGRIYRNRNMSEEATEAFFKAVEIAPDYVEARAALAKEYFNQDQFDLALEEFEMVYLFNTESAEVHYYLWLLYTQEGDMEKANHSRDLAIQYDPSYAQLIEGAN